MTTVAYQGEPGSYSDASVTALFGAAQRLPCATFAAAFAAVKDGSADRAVIPVENRVAGRVADVHHLLRETRLHIVGEHFQPVAHCLLGVPGATMADIKTVLSHEQALAQVRLFLAKHALLPAVYFDTAGAAAEVARRNDKSVAAVASNRAGELYGLNTLAANIADNPANATRFLVLARTPQIPTPAIACITTLVFSLRSVPAALYKALGGFATNGVNLTKIESYLSPEDFTSAEFYVDIEGHPETEACQHALDELRFFTTRLDILGTYPAAPQRD